MTRGPMLRFRYLTPFALLALAPLGGWLGGAWTYGAAAATIICMPGLDFALRDHDPSERSVSALTKWLPRIYILAQLSATAWMALIASRPETSLFELVGLASSAGLTTGVFGFVAAHAMIHSRDDRERFLGLAMFATTFYMHFHIAHLYGHHRRAATNEDPASARLGEGLYAFLLRSVGGQLREAWTYEAERMRKRGRPVLGLGNRMQMYLATEATLVIVLALWNWRALAFIVATAVIAVALLETFNYVAHYGLRRAIGRDGRIERLTSSHSWNSRRLIDSGALSNMGYHSDHHSHPSRPFGHLWSVPGAAELPFGYATALLAALVPPVWRQIMDKRANSAMATTSERIPNPQSEIRSSDFSIR